MRETYQVGDGKFLPVLREMDPPCDQCPREGPHNEKRYTLSSRNWQAFKLWSKIKATHGAYQLHPKIATCPLFADNMWIIERSIEAGKNAAELQRYRKSREQAERDRN